MAGDYTEDKPRKTFKINRDPLPLPPEAGVDDGGMDEGLATFSVEPGAISHDCKVGDTYPATIRVVNKSDAGVDFVVESIESPLEELPSSETPLTGSSVNDEGELD